MVRRVELKNRQSVKPRSPYATALAGRLFRQRVKPGQRTYRRKLKHKELGR